jgi:glyoxylase-like metal-dependent hydrolase (beta-lactamase superfamily II)
MALGDLYEATAGDSTDLYYVDTEMYDTPEYGSIYILDAERPALVDTGIGLRYETILDAMDEVGIAPKELEVIAPTHVHLDHAGGAGYLAEACPNAKVYVHETGAQHLVDPERLWEGTKSAVESQIEYYAEPKPVPEARITELTDGDTIDLGDHQLDVHYAPGHAPHQAVYYDPVCDGVFTADAAGICTPATNGVRQTSPPPTFDLPQVLADVEMLQDLAPSALYYGHFGDWDADDRLAEYATISEEWVGEVERVREELDDDEAVIEHFQETTDATEVWGDRKGRDEERLNVRGVLRYLDGKES